MRSSFWDFWLILFRNVFLVLIPVVVFFVSLERIFCIRWPLFHEAKRKKLLISFAFLNIVIVCIIGWSVIRDGLPPAIVKCRSFACLFTRNQITLFTYLRIICGSLNFLAGSVFLYQIWHHGRKKLAVSSTQNWESSTSRTTNGTKERSRKAAYAYKLHLMAGLIVSMDFLLNFLPYIVSYILSRAKWREFECSCAPFSSQN
ncbi:hypothetical protein DdX_17266 [Ditylenchus destructor]|uniref:Uncharacterized protein n=1 Tax=Ditylenchus destructor TaxID=166010 RepID=A0AAD4QVY3_9BILA|nr:hypothetical protein DdX_17266 [Ditylenchus destructor]